MTGISAGCVAIARPYAPRTPGRPVTMPAFPARLTCNPVLTRSCPNRPVTTGKTLLMRLGGNTLRGSNPRSSALTSSYVRALRLGGLLLSPFRGLCVATAAIRPPIYLIRYPRRRAGLSHARKPGRLAHNQSVGRDVCLWFASRVPADGHPPVRQHRHRLRPAFVAAERDRAGTRLRRVPDEDPEAPDADHPPVRQHRHRTHPAVWIGAQVDRVGARLIRVPRPARSMLALARMNPDRLARPGSWR